MNPRRSRAWIVLAVALGVGLRLCTLGEVNRPGRVNPLSPDCLYHLRRARFALAHFPRTIVRDPMINYPDGGVCIWPPLFDLSLALPALVARGPAAPRELFERTAMAVPLLFAAGAILAAALAGSALRRRWGIAAAFYVALCPGFFHYSQFGQTDQHVAEACWGFLALAFWLQACRKERVSREILAGLCLALAVLTWQGAIFWAPLLAVGVLATARREPLLAARRAALVLGAPALLVAAATRYWLLGFRVPFTYISFGWFQPVFLGLVCAATVILILGTGRGRIPARVNGALALLAAAGALPAALAFRPFLAALGQGVAHLASRSQGSPVVAGGFLSYSKEWLAQIIEYRPLFADDWNLPLRLLSFAFLLSPAVIALWGVRALRGRRPDANATLAAWGAFTFFFACAQRRNMYYAALLAALTALEIGAWAAARLRRRMRRDERGAAGAPVFLAVFAVLALPMLPGLRDEMRSRFAPGQDLLGTLDRLREIADPVLDPYDARFLAPGSSIPELPRAESVMLPWSLGHAVTYYSERPVVADNFGYGFFDSIRFFLAESEDEALSIASARRARFVLAADLDPKMNDYARILRRPDFFVSTARATAATAAYFRTLQARLMLFDAKGGELANGARVEPLARFRLRYASRTGDLRFGRFVPRWKIFEIVQSPRP